MTLFVLFFKLNDYILSREPVTHKCRLKQKMTEKYVLKKNYKNKKIHDKPFFWCKIILPGTFYIKENCYEFTK